MKKETFAIKGMHCASCARTIEKALSKVEGVKSAVVNFIAEKATVEFDEKRVGVEKLAKAVKNVGYELITREGGEEGKTRDQERSEREKELVDLKRKIAIGGIVSGLALSLTHCWWPFLSEIPQQTAFLLLFFLSTPIQIWLGKSFYQGTIQALKNLRANMDTLVALGTTIAYLYSVFLTFFPSYFTKAGIELHVYYDTAVLLLTIITFGQFLEKRARSQAGEAIKKLMGLQPKEATVLLKKGDERLKILNSKSEILNKS